MFRLYPEQRSQPRRTRHVPPPISVPSPSFPIACALRVSAFSSPNLSPFDFKLPTLNCCFPKSHRITFFADSCHLALIESHSYKKQGEGREVRVVNHAAQLVPSLSTASKHGPHSNARNSIPLNGLLHTSHHTRGVGYRSGPSRLHPGTGHNSPVTIFQNFYPPASDLRHNPAAQGHITVRIAKRTHFIPRAGRIQ